VALKLIRNDLVSPSILRRFENEAEVLGRLRHPGIVQVFEAGVADIGDGPQPFIAMELIAGLPLTRFAEVNTLSIEAKLALIVRVCEAVQHAHQRGIIHRDLKPANILVDAADQPKVLDFGVARAVDADPGNNKFQTSGGQFLGTLAYMSPEQLDATATDVDTRSDVYALGVVCY
jgi:serine/threonine protein kinase